MQIFLFHFSSIVEAEVGKREEKECTSIDLFKSIQE
jgi:hypothetical protein